MNCRYKVFFIISIFFLLAPCLALYSQNPRDLRVFAYNVKKSPTLGLKGGVLLSTITGDGAIDQFAKKIGAQIGVTGAVYLHPQLSFRGEINYESKGGKFANHDMKMNLHYATVPIYVKFNFTQDPEIYIYAGGYASYLFMANTKGAFENLDEVAVIDEDILPNLNQFDAGYLVGAGVQGRYNRNMDLFLDFRYTQGFINLDKNTADLRYNFNYDIFWPEQSLGKPKNKTIMLSAGVIIYLQPR